MAETAPTRFHSGIRNPKEAPAGPKDDTALRAANEELQRRTAQHLEAVVSVVIEQRDTALRKLEALEVGARDWQTQRENLEAEHRRATESMLSLHQKELDALTRQLEHLKQARAQTEAGASLPVDRTASSPTNELRQQLEEAQAELEAMRADAREVQGERDRALAQVDDVRLELLSQLEAARDEAIDLQARLDETDQRVDQIRDEADVEIYRLNEEIHDLRQQLEQRLTA
jgi:chromosome segregation ATPase